MRYSKIMRINANNIDEEYIVEFEIANNLNTIKQLLNEIKDDLMVEKDMIGLINNIVECNYDYVIDVFFKQKNGFNRSGGSRFHHRGANRNGGFGGNERKRRCAFSRD